MHRSADSVCLQRQLSGSPDRLAGGQAPYVASRGLRPCTPDAGRRKTPHRRVEPNGMSHPAFPWQNIRAVPVWGESTRVARSHGRPRWGVKMGRGRTCHDAGPVTWRSVWTMTIDALFLPRRQPYQMCIGRESDRRPRRTGSSKMTCHTLCRPAGVPAVIHGGPFQVAQRLPIPLLAGTNMLEVRVPGRRFLAGNFHGTMAGLTQRHDAGCCKQRARDRLCYAPPAGEGCVCGHAMDIAHAGASEACGRPRGRRYRPDQRGRRGEAGDLSRGTRCRTNKTRCPATRRADVLECSTRTFISIRKTEARRHGQIGLRILNVV
jgi:hypothetical protein